MVHYPCLLRVLAGPWVTQTMGDLGAEVIKIERPETGDDTRAWGPPFVQDAAGNATGESAMCANRNKQSMVVDFTRSQGQDVVRRLAVQCDVLLENFKTGRPDGEPGAGPVKVGVALADILTGLYASTAILAALQAHTHGARPAHRFGAVGRASRLLREPSELFLQRPSAAAHGQRPPQRRAVSGVCHGR